MAESTTHEPPDSPPLRRRNSITTATSANKLSLPSTLPQLTKTTSLELVSMKSPFSASYTSLRDMLPPPNAAVNSPTSSAYSGKEISIRNRLVKQAAWAYLQPMSASPGGSATPHVFRRFYHHLRLLYHHIVPVVSRFFRRVFHALRLHVWTRCYFS